MKRGLFLSHDGVGSSIFESQVATHASEMFDLGLTLDLAVYEVFRKAFSGSRSNAESIATKYPVVNLKLMRAVNIYIPFASILNAIIFLIFMIGRSGQYSFIHARSDYSAFIALLTKPFHKLEVVWDCRGDSQDELKFSLSKKSLFLRMTLGIYLRLTNKMIIKLIKRFSDGCIFVSDALYSLHKNGLKINKYIIVPCTVPEKYFYFNENLRRNSRKELGYSDEDKVLLYSGSMVKYQGIDLAYVFFRGALAASNRAKVIILTTQLKEANIIFGGLDKARVSIKNCAFEDVNSYYNAADFAVLFRESRSLNYVASPTKFGEYCMAGIPVVMNNTVKQAYDYSIDIGNHYDMTAFDFPDVSGLNRQFISEQAKLLYSRNTYNSCYFNLYSSFG